MPLNSTNYTVLYPQNGRYSERYIRLRASGNTKILGTGFNFWSISQAVDSKLYTIWKVSSFVNFRERQGCILMIGVLKFCCDFQFFRISQGSVATHLMQAKNLNQTHTEFTGESVSEGFRKSVYVCRSYDLKSSVPFLPRDTVLARYMLSSRVLPSVCVSVRYTPVLCQNGWT